MKRRVFLTKGASGVFALGAVGCSNDNKQNPLSSSPNGGMISGMIADAEGNGIGDVSLKIYRSGFAATARTDADGRYSVAVTGDGDYTLSPRKEGYRFDPKSQKVTVTGTQMFVVNILAIVEATHGSILTTELGTTGIMVSKFGFGSHVNSAHRGSVREKIIRTAFDYGVNTFDVYDVESSHNQYEPMGRYLAPVIQDSVISISLCPAAGLSPEEEIDRARQLFGKDCIDMVRMHLWAPDHSDFNLEWWMWEELFRLRDLGKIGAVGIPVHQMSDLEMTLQEYPDDLDYVIFPYNFYHNIGWPYDLYPEWPTFPQELRDRGIGVISIKPFAGDYFVGTLKEAAASINPDLSFNQAALRYVINSGLEPDSTFTGMNAFTEFTENIRAYHEPEMSDDDVALLEDVKAVAEKTAHAVLPDHYRFLDDWAPKPSAHQGTTLV